ncbi:hypothetical protein Tco_0682213 [Tanacetum coccineum]|uniref:Uncharacterized protein n=1 Tax=Tanacetum coccineum TaxID=301880 RepID=A0ABQ4XQS6_9ASTR
MNDYKESAGIQENSDSDLQSMPDDDLRFVSGFEAADSYDTHDNEVSHSAHTSQDDIASAKRLSLPDHMDHICEEVISLHSRLEDLISSIAQSVSDEIQSSLPTLVTNALKEQLPRIISATLKDYMKTQLQDVKDLLESAVIIDETAEGEKKQKDKNAIPALTQGEHQTYENITPPEPTPETQGKQPTPPRDEPKEKGIATKEPLKDIIPFIEEGGSVPKIPNLKSFILPEGTLSQEKFIAQLKVMKRLSNLKEQEKKSEEELKKILNPATIKAQALKWEEHEEKKANMLNEFNKCISQRNNPLPITKISYVVNSSKVATMRITRDNDPLNLTSLKAKFQWVLNQANKLGLPPPPTLASFGMTAEERKRKRIEFIKEVFVSEDVRVDEMERNLVPSPGIVPIQGLVINEPEPGIFFMNRNTDIALESNIRRIQVKDIIKEVEDHLKTYSSAGIDISCYVEVIRDTLMEFSKVSGLKPNMGKSIPLLAKKVGINDCKILVDRVKGKVNDWKNKTLSYAGRLQLITSVLTAMQTYWVSVVMLPKATIKEINMFPTGGSTLNGKGVVRVTSRGLDMALHSSGVRTAPLMSPRQDETSEPLLYVGWMDGPYRYNRCLYDARLMKEWYNDFPILYGVRVPHLIHDKADVVRWKTKKGQKINFSTQKAWLDIKEEFPKVNWWKLVWYSSVIQDVHSFCGWPLKANFLLKTK